MHCDTSTRARRNIVLWQMELDALTITCRHLHNERDDALAKLARQKHAAHVMCHRLRWKLRKMELSNRLLLGIFLATENHNQVLREQAKRLVEDDLRDLPALGV